MDSSCLHYKVGKEEEKKTNILFFSGLNLVIIYIVWRDKHLLCERYKSILKPEKW